MRIYLAARYARRYEMQAVATELREMGHEVTSRWIGGSYEMEEHVPPRERARLALEDYEDLMRADCVISFTEGPLEPLDQPGHGGRHVEFGLALALGKRVIIVGWRENVFHYLPVVEWFERWGQCRESLGGLCSEAAPGGGTLRQIRERPRSVRGKRR